MLDPFQIDHVGRKVEGGVSVDVVIAVGHKVGPSGPAETAVLHGLGLDRRMVEDRAASLEERADVIGKPKR